MRNPEEALTIETYDKIAPQWNNAYNDTFFWREAMIKFSALLSRPLSRVIDIGCGSARDADLIRMQGFTYVGVDLSGGMLREAVNKCRDRGNSHSRFARMNMCRIGFRPSTFHGFWAAASLIHIPKRNMGVVLSEISSVVVQNGIGFIAMKAGTGEEVQVGKFSDDRRFVALYSPAEFIEILESKGMEVIDFHLDQREAESRNVRWLTYFVKVWK